MVPPIGDDAWCSDPASNSYSDAVWQARCSSDDRVRRWPRTGYSGEKMCDGPPLTANTLNDHYVRYASYPERKGCGIRLVAGEEQDGMPGLMNFTNKDLHGRTLNEAVSRRMTVRSDHDNEWMILHFRCTEAYILAAHDGRVNMAGPVDGCSGTERNRPMFKLENDDVNFATSSPHIDCSVHVHEIHDNVEFQDVLADVRGLDCGEKMCAASITNGRLRLTNEGGGTCGFFVYPAKLLTSLAAYTSVTQVQYTQFGSIGCWDRDCNRLPQLEDSSCCGQQRNDQQECELTTFGCGVDETRLMRE
eukprot:CAMPEP_0117001622 /NCGR_PEP_ID=MMETSP0472-20121206/3560_1 /TAXON_ID=693140 ORGANISM="Tiarina fusus, Strain LIS" /NCGR_SAMPLE_ID=MMETSP0472 /ASSEMBLY_ACC=CAM_ASM_000603 /LENGTH=303 /DNA_ID=CAMNT_0004701691 /DNA_START=463 /DNA_END=1374 /DNA_ORIENTATION=-